MKKNNINKKFAIVVSYKENKYQHEIVESWICNSMKDIKRVLNECLDILAIDKRGIDIPMQTFEEVHKNLVGFADEKFIKKEYNRLKKNRSIYDSMIECAKNFEQDDDKEEWKIDSKTIIGLERIK